MVGVAASASFLASNMARNTASAASISIPVCRPKTV